MNKTNPLLGKKVTAVHLAEDKLAIKFGVEGSDPIVAKVDGDCCSRSWIENVENWQALVGAVVTSVEDIEMPEHPEGPDEEVVKFYGLKITTDRGHCVIDYRNESNGYYGGNLSWPGDYHYGGVFKQNVSEEKWKELDS